MRKLNLIETLRRWLKPGKKAAPLALQRVRKTVAPHAVRRHEIEPLETRIAPAILVNPMTVMYQDADGDLVTVKSSKAIFNNTNLNSVFTFDTGPVGGTGTAQQLQTLDLKAAVNVVGTLPVTASGASITISATKAGGGNGAVDIGYIHAAAISLGAVTIKGDLGRIDAGGTTGLGVTSLSVQSLGTRGLATQSAATPSLISDITGGLGSLLVSGNVQDVTFDVFNGATLFPGKIGSLTINGSLLGGTADNTGLIHAAGDIGPVKIGVNLSGNDGMNSGQISGGKISSLTIGGSMIGGKGVSSGSVETTGNVGAIKVGGAILGGEGNNSAEIRSGGKIASVEVGAALPLNLSTAISGGKGASSGLVLSTAEMGAVKIHGDIEGGDGANSGEVFSGGKLTSATIYGKLVNSQYMGLIGGKGLDSGTLVSFSDIGLVKIAGDIRGGDGEQSGQINASGNLAGVTVTNGGSVIGGLGLRSGAISSIGGMGAVNIAKDLQGGPGTLSGDILVQDSLVSAVVGGSLIGGTVDESGEVLVFGNIGSVKVLGDVTGTAMLDTGSIFAGGKIGTVTIGGKLTGGGGDNSGSVFSGTDPSVPGDLTSIIVSGEVAGGSGANSGQINSGGNIGSAMLNKSLTGGAGNFSGMISAAKTITTVTVKNDVRGAGGANSGQIEGNKIKAVTIYGSLIGSSGENSGAILSQTIFGPDQDIQGDIGRVTINGIDGVKGSTGAGSGQINSAGTLTSVTIAHSLTGGSGGKSGSILSGTDSITSGLMSAVTINGEIQGGSIRSGDAIGSIFVKGNVGAEATPVTISARGQTVQTATDLAIKSISVGGSVASTNILAGYDTNLIPLNPDAQIGSVRVTHDWRASSIAAGIADAALDGFGNATNAKISGPDNLAIVSKIASVVIGGNVFGTAAAGDHFGFVAQQIGALKYGVTTVPLTTNFAPDIFDPINAGTPDTSIREFAV